ncbi:MAG TPA: Re/Si-specific NAD(P)(+) transhydrogenase subunit alpha [Acidimicrobiales bacterium]|nr:Re/Si-specific NAD(P)(+) transhydrogenase subunit alpha [Acidimicrobiales bacterium]
MTLTIGVGREPGVGERRVALTPDAVSRVRDLGVEVIVQAGAGAEAVFDDEDYAKAGATVAADRAEVLAACDLLAVVGRPPPEELDQLRTGQALVGLLQPLLDAPAMAALAAKGVTAVSLDGLPRTLPRAQSMDALTSQANVAGYKSVLVATEHFSRYLPLLITAAGTSKPAELLVLGAGVAGLSAIGTARRLGALVRAYDVRPAAKGEVHSVGAQWIELTSVGPAAGEGGYARALTPEEQAAQAEELAGHIARHDIVITTAQVPGRRPPRLVSEEAVAAMRPGSVIVDMGASELGGNVAGSQPGRVVHTDNRVTIVGAGDLPSRLPTSASAAYARNLTALLAHLLADGQLVVDPDDEITAGVVVTHGGTVVHPGVAALLDRPEEARP